MLIDELRKRPSFAAKTNDEEVVTHVDHLVSEAGRVSGLETENTELKARIADFEKKEADAAEAARNAMVDAAVKDGRIKEVQREVYLNLLKADPVNGEAALKSLKPVRRVMDDIVDKGGKEESPWKKRMKEIQDNLK